MPLPTGHLAAHPVPPGVVGALTLQGYQLLADIAGVGAGRLGSQAFLLVAPDPDSALGDTMTHVTLHQSRLRDEADAASYVQLAAAIGYLRLSGYRLALERAGLRSRARLVDPATGRIAIELPEKAGGRLLRGVSASSLLPVVRAVPPAGPPPDLEQPELLRGVLLALALGDESLGGAQAADAADRALTLMQDDAALDPRGALAAATGAVTDG